jgi:hypothetical protein
LCHPILVGHNAGQLPQEQAQARAWTRDNHRKSQ